MGLMESQQRIRAAAKATDDTDAAIDRVCAGPVAKFVSR
jgi:hypothetical protein